MAHALVAADKAPEILSLVESHRFRLLKNAA